LTSYQPPSAQSAALPSVPCLKTATLLHDYFEQQAAQHPTQIALVCHEQRLSYGQLEERSNQLAHYLGTRGIGIGTRVGLLLERSIEVYIAVLGILKAGAAYVPMDPDYPTDRVQYILTDSEVELLLTTPAMLAKHPDLPCPSFCLDPEILNRQPTTSPSLEIAARELCYIIYTSGSTGRPKGVMLEHRHAVNFVWAAQDVYGVQSTDRFYQGFSIAFDICGGRHFGSGYGRDGASGQRSGGHLNSFGSHRFFLCTDFVVDVARRFADSAPFDFRGRSLSARAGSALVQSAAKDFKYLWPYGSDGRSDLFGM
jgi:non-ribosomal peptide synthetase component F